MKKLSDIIMIILILGAIFGYMAWYSYQSDKMIEQYAQQIGVVK